MKLFLLTVAFGLILCSSASADHKQGWANQMAHVGMSHDPSYNGRENVFWSSNTAFPRIQARMAWRGSPGHRANLPMFGLRVSRSNGNVYVVGRR